MNLGRVTFASRLPPCAQSFVLPSVSSGSFVWLLSLPSLSAPPPLTVIVMPVLSHSI